jgi:hypothetical protein
MAVFDSAEVERIASETSKANDVIQISIPTTKQTFVLEKSTNVFGETSYSVSSQAYTPATAPVPVPVSEGILTPEQKAKLKEDVESFLAKSGEEAKKVAESLRARIDAYLAARKQSSTEKLSEGVA